MWKLKNTLLLSLFIVLTNFSFGQKGTQSPYSSFGIGERNQEGYAVISSLGGMSMGNTDSTLVNTANPASYSYFSRNLPVFQLGMNGKISTFSTETSSTAQRHFGLNQFQLGLPIKKKWGAAIGIKPYSFTGYTITKYEIADEDTTKQFINEGSGGIRIANFGLSYKPISTRKKDSIKISVTGLDTLTKKKEHKYLEGYRTHKMSLGFNANYLFGTSQHIRSAEFLPSPSPFNNARVVDGLRVSGLTWELGLNYQVSFQSLGITRGLSVGATFSPATKVRAYQDLFSFSYLNSFYNGEPTKLVDTIAFIQDNQGIILKPQAYAVGFEYRFTPYKSGLSLRVGVDYKTEKWSTFYTEFSDVKTTGGLKDRQSLHIGFEWAPTQTTLLAPDTRFLSKIKYRIGLNYAQTELLVKNNLNQEIEINNYGMSFGVGIPILAGVSNTNINFGGSIGNLGTTENGIIQEQYMGLYFGISITPLKSNRWFIKRKYN